MLVLVLAAARTFTAAAATTAFTTAAAHFADAAAGDLVTANSAAGAGLGGLLSAVPVRSCGVLL